jgi:hypothetical protein
LRRFAKVVRLVTLERHDSLRVQRGIDEQARLGKIKLWHRHVPVPDFLTQRGQIYAIIDLLTDAAPCSCQIPRVVCAGQES